MVYSFSFHVPGKPRGAARPRFTRQGHAYTLREDQIYRALVAAKARKAIRSTRYSGESAQNFRVDIGVFFKIPSSWAKAKKAAALRGEISPSKPDCDNVAKIVLDSLNGIAWVDDSKVSILTVRKQYSDAYEGIRVWVEAEPTDRREA
jgi:Holliday junction resolvase RusA-like endonuclease